MRRPHFGTVDCIQPALSTPTRHPRSLEIALVTETYPPEVNGVAMTIGRIVAGLLERGHRIDVVRPRQHPSEQPCRTAQLEEMLVRGMVIPCYDSLKLGFPSTAALRSRWTQRRPDVVHVTTEGPLGWSALRAARALGLPVAADFHTNFHSYCEHYGAGWLRQPVIGYLRRFHGRVHCTMVPTQGLRTELERLRFRDLTVVARGVDTALFHPARRSQDLRALWGAAPADPVVLYVGRLAPEKNLPLALEAYEAMRTVQPRVRLVIVGDGPDRASLQQRARSAVFAGLRNGTDLATHYASADVFLFPSVTETYGNVTVEAMASGLAVVAYDYAAAAEHIRHERNGIAVPYGDRAAFVQLAAGLTIDRSRFVRLGRNARVSTERLDWTRIVAEFERTLLALVAKEDEDELAPCLPA